MLEHIDTVELPEYSIVFFEYGDIEGYSEEELNDFGIFLDQYHDMGYTNITLSYDFDSKGFTAYPEFGLACDTVTTDVYGEKDET